MGQGGSGHADLNLAALMSTPTATPFSSAPFGPGEIAVQHNAPAHRFEATVEGYRSVADYELVDDSVVFTHTFVPPELRGRGVAEKLVRTALGWARAEKRHVVPSCSYVARFIERHAEFRSLLR